MYGLSSLTVSGLRDSIEPEDRPFQWSGSLAPNTLPKALVALFCSRRRLLERDAAISLVENPTMKRLWRGKSGESGRYGGDYAERFRVAAQAWLAEWLEETVKNRVDVVTVRELRQVVPRDKRFTAVASACVDQEVHDYSEILRGVLSRESVPFLPSLTYTTSGMEKRSVWERTWDSQRCEDAGEAVADIPVPPAYSQGSRGKVKDFLLDEYWDLRGKLDVPKERFISYPGCESGEDGEPVYGWAGWDHLQRAQALAALYNARREEGWAAEDKKERLVPMLAGLLELLPWLMQWHNEPSEELGGARPGEQFGLFLEAQCTELGFTREQLRGWRPAGKKRAAEKKAPAKMRSAKTAEGETSEAKPRKKRAAKKAKAEG